MLGQFEPARPAPPTRPTRRTHPRIRPSSMTDGFAYPTGLLFLRFSPSGPLQRRFVSGRLSPPAGESRRDLFDPGLARIGLGNFCDHPSKVAAARAVLLDEPARRKRPDAEPRRRPQPGALHAPVM